MSRTTERRAVTRLDPATRRTQIIESAARLFEEHDPGEIPFEEIADAAGVSRALVYNYFGDRGGLLAAVYLHHFSAVNARISEVARAATGSSERVRAMVGAYLEFAARHPGAWRLLRVAPAIEHPDVRASRRQRMTEIAGYLGGTPAALVVAYGLTGLLEEATLQWLETSRTDPDRIADVLHALMWQGLASVDGHDVTLAI